MYFISWTNLNVSQDSNRQKRVTLNRADWGTKSTEKGEIIQLNLNDCYLKALSDGRASVDWSEFNLRNVFAWIVKWVHLEVRGQGRGWCSSTSGLEFAEFVFQFSGHIVLQRLVTCPGCGPASFPVGQTRKMNIPYSPLFLGCKDLSAFLAVSEFRPAVMKTFTSCSSPKHLFPHTIDLELWS